MFLRFISFECILHSSHRDASQRIERWEMAHVESLSWLLHSPICVRDVFYRGKRRGVFEFFRRGGRIGDIHRRVSHDDISHLGGGPKYIIQYNTILKRWKSWGLVVAIDAQVNKNSSVFFYFVAFTTTRLLVRSSLTEAIKKTTAIRWRWNNSQ